MLLFYYYLMLIISLFPWTGILFLIMRLGVHLLNSLGSFFLGEEFWIPLAA